MCVSGPMTPPLLLPLAAYHVGSELCERGGGMVLDSLPGFPAQRAAETSVLWSRQMLAFG